MKKILTLAVLGWTMMAGAQQLPSTTSADIYLGLRKLNVLGSVLYVAAHPDDENTRLLTWLAKDRLYRTGYLSLTRGDGGQNLIGNEQGIELGLIRTQELLAARRIDGAEQFFTRAYDFGFSKNPEETFTKWDREKILSDVVWVIRQFQPDVIITRFPTTGEGGHGHHTASAILANEAFAAAADPKRFPEQLKWVQPWQARRILWNTFNFGGNNTTSADQYRVDVGGYNAILGRSYGEIAADSRSQHKSQGFGVARSRGEAWEYFTRTGGAPFRDDLAEGVNTGWSRIKDGERIGSLVQNAISTFDFLYPHKSVPALVNIHKALQRQPDGYWKERKLQEVQQLIEQAGGFWVEAFTGQQQAVAGDSVRVSFVVNNRSGTAATLKRVTVEGFDTALNQVLAGNRNLAFAKTIGVSAARKASQPYWLELKMEEGYFNVQDPLLIGLPEGAPAFSARITLNIEGQDFQWTKPVRYKYTDPVKGEVYQPVAVLPPVEVQYTSENYLSVNGAPVSVGLQFSNNRRDSVPYPVRFLHSANWTSTQPNFSFTGRGNGAAQHNSLLQPAGKGRNAREPVTVAGGRDQQVLQYRRVIQYDHIPTITYFHPATANLVQLDLRTAGKKIGYIVGAGDKVPEALDGMGYEVTLLGDKELSRNQLQQFDAIITGVRAYNTNEWMNSHYDRLMQYVEGGGNLIVQYNTSNQIGPVRAKMGPYPFSISRTRVTDEKARVNILKADHPAFNFPNKITPQDFEGWVQERSIYHAAAYDRNFEALLSMNDPGEQPDAGSLITARYGKGFFTYTGIVFFRELPAGVPGAYRLLANLIALNQKKAL